MPDSSRAALVRQGEAVGLKSYPAADANVLSLKHTALFGIEPIGTPDEDLKAIPG